MHRRYADRRDAGRMLAALLDKYKDVDDLLVLGLPRGGVPVADEVARALGAPLDVLVVRKLGVPGQPEVAMGAIASVAGSIETVENTSITAQLGHLGSAHSAFDRVAAHEEKELRRREEAYRGNLPRLDLTDKIVMLVDDGLATGATMRAAVTAVRHEAPRKIVVAVPIALSNTADEMRLFADEVICAWTPANFFGVGQAYVRFDQTTDDEVRRILAVDGFRPGSEQR